MAWHYSTEEAPMAAIYGDKTTLQPARLEDAEQLARIREAPEVFARWRGVDLLAEVLDAITATDVHLLTIADETGAIVGAIQWYEEDDPDYRHAGIDLFLDPEVHGRGLGSDAIRALARHLFTEQGHHRLIIDPAASNIAAIRANEKVGFRRVGTMRRYERDADGVWQDGVLMELLAEDLK
jgi:aminoglycoside 6'-N-acetyltransferase